MNHKVFEVRDRMTCIPVLAIQTIPENQIQAHYLARYGFGRSLPDQAALVLLFSLNGDKVTDDPAFWMDRTLTTAHRHIQDNFNTLAEGSVVDVRFILGEEPTPADPEIWMNLPACAQCQSTDLLSGYGFAAGPLGTYTLCGSCGFVQRFKPDPEGQVIDGKAINQEQESPASQEG